MTSPMCPPSRLTIVSVFAGGIACHLLTIGIARFAYTPMLTVMRDQGVLQVDTGGWVGAMIYAGYLLGALMLSFLKQGNIRILVFRASLLVAMASTFTMAATENAALWGLSRFIAGFSGVAAMLLAAEFILAWLREHHLRPDLGPHYVGLGLGISLSGIVALWMGTEMYWGNQWLIYGAIAVLLLPFAWFLTPIPSPQHKRENQADEKPQGTAAPLHDSLYPPATPKWFWLFGLGYFTAGWGYAVGATFSVDILTNVIGSNNAAVLIWIVLGGATACGAILGSVATRRLGIRKVVILSMIGQTLSIAGYAVFTSPVLIFAAALLFGACFIAVVSLTLMLSGLKSPENPGAAMARMTMSYGLGQISGPALTGWLVAGLSSYEPALWLVVLLMSIGTALMIVAGHVE